MDFLPKSILRLTESLKGLPGVGQKTAERLALFIMKKPEDWREEFATAVFQCGKNVTFCKECFNFADGETCVLCQDDSRERDVLCVVEDWLDLVAIEKAQFFKGLFHVLTGAISPLAGIGPGDLKIDELEGRIARGDFSEIVLATNPNLEGEATAMHIFRILQSKFPALKVTRLAMGLPAGGNLEFTDGHTLQKAFAGRLRFG